MSKAPTEADMREVARRMNLQTEPVTINGLPMNPCETCYTLMKAEDKEKFASQWSPALLRHLLEQHRGDKPYELNSVKIPDTSH